MNEDLAPEYVDAREALLDALEALQEHRDAIIVAGAQAVTIATVSTTRTPPMSTG